MSYFEIRENVRFIAWGKSNGKEGNRVVDVNESIEVTVDEMKRSSKYSVDSNDPSKRKDVYVYHLREKNSKSSDATLLLIPPTDLMNKFKLGNVEVGDALKITYLGEKLTGRGKPMKHFKLEKEV